MTKDEAFQEYEEAIKLAYEAKEKARATLREQIENLRKAAHEELKALRVIEQKTKRSR